MQWGKKNQNDIFVGFKISGQSIFFNNTENYHNDFVGTGIRGSDPPRTPRKLVAHEI